MIIGHRNYRSYDEVMIKLPYNEFVTMIIIIFFENMVIDAFLACLFNVHYLIFCLWFMNMHIFYEYIWKSVYKVAYQIMLFQMTICRHFWLVHNLMSLMFMWQCDSQQYGSSELLNVGRLCCGCLRYTAGSADHSITRSRISKSVYAGVHR